MFKRTIGMTMIAAGLMACGGDSAEEAAPAAEVAPAEAPGAVSDEQQLADLASYWETHYNMGHADMVASVYGEEAFALPASGNVLEGRAAIEADLAAGFDSSPVATVTPTEHLIFGDMAVGLGTYSVETAEGGWAGSWFNVYTKETGEWQIVANISNYNAEPPLDWAWDTYEGETPENEGTMGELIEFYQSNFNIGHSAELANAYTNDAVISVADGPFMSGMAAILADLEANAQTGVILTINDVATMPLEDGWAVDAGWYQMDASDGGDAVRFGNYLNLVQQQADGSWKIHRMVTNGFPAAAMSGM